MSRRGPISIEARPWAVIYVRWYHWGLRRQEYRFVIRKRYRNEFTQSTDRKPQYATMDEALQMMRRYLGA